MGLETSGQLSVNGVVRLRKRGQWTVLCQLVIRERVGMSSLSVEFLLGKLLVAAFFFVGSAVILPLLSFA